MAYIAEEMVMLEDTCYTLLHCITGLLIFSHEIQREAWKWEKFSKVLVRDFYAPVLFILLEVELNFWFVQNLWNTEFNSAVENK